MANNKMLIDASHREETRVVVLRGNRIEEFDFEAQERRQLRGNIYLAKVTRVEPSLQAAFIDYGGNRHGFLAFSEIHPDYYQIPAADRQALLDEEAQDAVADAASDEDGADASSRVAAEKTEETTEETEATVETVEVEAEEKPKKRRRRSRRKPKTEASAEGEVEVNSSNSADDSSDKDTTKSDDNGGGASDGTTMAAMVEMDSISEPAPEDGADSDSDAADASEEVAEEKPKKRRTTRRTTRKKKTDPEVSTEEASVEETPKEEVIATTESDATENTENAPKKRTTRRRKKKTDEEGEDSESTTQAVEPEKADNNDTKNAKPAKRKPRRSRKAKEQEVEAEAGENGESIENAGQEDAMEEVPVRRKSRRQYKIQEVIRRRQVLLVQVVKEERGNKGAALTTYLSLAGRYSVLMPNTARGGGISRKITNASDRKRLKEIANGLDVPAGMGVILRTAGASRTDAEINRDFDYLMRLWENVRNLTLESSAPYLVYEEGSLIKRSIRDLYNKDIGEVIVSGEDGFKEAKQFMQMLEPSQTKNVKLYRGEAPILSRYGVETQLDKMLATQVTLKSGGYLVIDQTEALVAVDVNSGRSTREHSIEATAVQTNLEAAEEVARQLKLRDLAGLVVIDFIDMEEKRNNRAVEKRMKECLKNDRARIQVGHISHFGLMEMSRQRMRASVLESTMEVCPHCQGIGHVRSPSSYSIHIMRALEEHLNRNSRNDVTVKVARNAALYMLNYQRSVLNELEERFGVKIIIEIDTSVEGQMHTFEKGPASTREPKQRAAVNPMDFGEENTVDGSEPATTASSTDSDENEEDKGNKKRRRRRRGGRGRGRDSDQTEQSTEQKENQEDANSVTENSNETPSQETATPSDTNDATATTETVAAAAEAPVEKPKRGRRKKVASVAEPVAEKVDAAETVAPAEAPKDEAPKKPRRATGRPGRKSKDTSQTTEETPAASPKPQETKAETPATIEVETAATTEETPKKTRRKTGRPGRKATNDEVAEKAESEAIAEVADDATPTAEEKPAKPKRRATRRVKTVAIEDDKSSEDAGSEKKKKSWIKGFFS